jgi:hypothetical protein
MSAFAQSKKEQIENLTHKVDSLEQVIAKERKITKEKVIELEEEVSNCKKQIVVIQEELTIARKELSIKETQILQEEKISAELRDTIKQLSEEVQILNAKIEKEKFYRSEFYTKDYNELMFDHSFKWDTILNPKNWHEKKIKIHGYDGWEQSYIYEVEGAPEYKLIHYRLNGETGGEKKYYLLKNQLLVLLFGSEFSLDQDTYPDKYEDVISFKYFTYFGENLNSNSANPDYHKNLKISLAIKDFVNGLIDENKLSNMMR